MIRNDIEWEKLWQEFKKSEPFNHVTIDDFFNEEIASQISEEFPSYNSENLNIHENALEIKRTHNRWDSFPPTTYRAFSIFGRSDFLYKMRGFVGNPDEESLWFDFGLNGGGWHMHSRGGNNNIHLDYNIHPKLNEQRKLNIIVYLTKDWDPSWGGGLELWTHDDKTRRPKDCVKTIENRYNRAIIFDTTQNSWHGLPKFINCPENVVRKSIAAYFVTKASKDTNKRGRALFAPREEQKNNPEIEELIRKRVNIYQSSDVYRKGN